MTHARTQVEEAYRSADSLCKQLGIDPGLVLRFEVPLLQVCAPCLLVRPMNPRDALKRVRARDCKGSCAPTHACAGHTHASAAAHKHTTNDTHAHRA
jgi:hypothetical protein